MISQGPQNEAANLNRILNNFIIKYHRDHGHTKMDPNLETWYKPEMDPNLATWYKPDGDASLYPWGSGTLLTLVARATVRNDYYLNDYYLERKGKEIIAHLIEKGADYKKIDNYPNVDPAIADLVPKEEIQYKIKRKLP
jgi:hypothetical protein